MQWKFFIHSESVRTRRFGTICKWRSWMFWYRFWSSTLSLIYTQQKMYVKRVLLQFDFWIFYFMYLVLYPFQFSANSFILFNIIACVFERWSSLSLDVLINILLDVLQGFVVFSLTRNSHIRMKTFIPKVCCISRREVLLSPFKVINQNRNMNFCKGRRLEVDRWWAVL